MLFSFLYMNILFLLLLLHCFQKSFLYFITAPHQHPEADCKHKMMDGRWELTFPPSHPGSISSVFRLSSHPLASSVSPAELTCFWGWCPSAHTLLCPKRLWMHKQRPISSQFPFRWEQRTQIIFPVFFTGKRCMESSPMHIKGEISKCLLLSFQFYN